MWRRGRDRVFCGRLQVQGISEVGLRHVLAFVKAVRPEPSPVGCEFEPDAAGVACGIEGSREQAVPYAPPPECGVDHELLDLGDPPRMMQLGLDLHVEERPGAGVGEPAAVFVLLPYEQDAPAVRELTLEDPEERAPVQLAPLEYAEQAPQRLAISKRRLSNQLLPSFPSRPAAPYPSHPV